MAELYDRREAPMAVLSSTRRDASMTRSYSWRDVPLAVLSNRWSHGSAI